MSVYLVIGHHKNTYTYIQAQAHARTLKPIIEISGAAFVYYKCVAEKFHIKAENPG